MITRSAFLFVMIFFSAAFSRGEDVIARYQSEQRLSNLPGLENVGVVASGLLRGSRPTSDGIATLKSMGVRTVVNLRHYHYRDEERDCKREGIEYIWLPLESSDAPSDSSIIEFLKIVTDTARQPVYIHCWRGKDRTGTMTAIYRMTIDNWPLDRALAEMDAYGFYRGWFDLRKAVTSYPDRVGTIRLRLRALNS